MGCWWHESLALLYAHTVKSESPDLLSFVDWMSCSDPYEDARFDSLQSFMLLAVLAHSGVLLADEGPLGDVGRTIITPLLLVSAVVGLGWRRFKPYCVMLTFGVTSFWLVQAWPRFANHLFLEWSVLLFLSLCRGDTRLGLAALRWLTAIVLFYSGFQKLILGHYFEGQFFLVLIASSPKFRVVFEMLLPVQEVARLVEWGGQFGTGPYETADTFFLILSNSIWIGEMMVGILLFFPKFRNLALVIAIGLVAGIEVGARELVFGCLFTLLILNFHQGRNAIAVWPVFAAIQLLSVAIRLVMPDLRFN